MSTDLKRIVEAVLFAAETPLSLTQICQVLETGDKERVNTALAELAREYDYLERAFALVEVAGGWRLRTRPDMAFWLRKLKRQSATRLSRASLETLAIIAYKQPVLKAEIERIRGVEVSGVLRMLMEKDLVRVVGRKDLPGRPLIYGTTRRFLEVFDLNDLSDLPTLEEMQELLGEPDLAGERGPEEEAGQDEIPLFTRGMAGQDQAYDDETPEGQEEAPPEATQEQNAPIEKGAGAESDEEAGGEATLDAAHDEAEPVAQNDSPGDRELAEDLAAADNDPDLEPEAASPDQGASTAGPAPSADDEYPGAPEPENLADEPQGLSEETQEDREASPPDDNGDDSGPRAA